MAGSRAFGGKRQMSTRERSELFVKRRNKQQMLDWTLVDQVELLTALTVGMREGATLSFAPAQGGIGVTLRVYRGDYADTEFAGSHEELTELLSLIVDGMSEGSEDPREIIKSLLHQRANSK